MCNAIPKHHADPILVKLIEVDLIRKLNCIVIFIEMYPEYRILFQKM